MNNEQPVVIGIFVETTYGYLDEVSMLLPSLDALLIHPGVHAVRGIHQAGSMEDS